jgi:hypothetical protein
MIRQSCKLKINFASLVYLKNTVLPLPIFLQYYYRPQLSFVPRRWANNTYSVYLIGLQCERMTLGMKVTSGHSRVASKSRLD